MKKSSKWEQRFTIQQLILHPKYKHSGYDYDLALLKVNGTININDRVRPACLPGLKTSFDVGTQCYITGWGLLKEFGNGPAVRNLFHLFILQEIQFPMSSYYLETSASFSKIIF